MDHRIEKMDEFRVVGLKRGTTTSNMQGMKDIQKFWSDVMAQQQQMQILPLMNIPPMGLLGISVYNVDNDNAKVFDYYIACATTQPAPAEMAEYIVPAATWAVFPCKRETMGQVQVQIITEWMPASGYRALNSGYETGEMQSGAPDIELYSQGEEVEIWVPVKKI